MSFDLDEKEMSLVYDALLERLSAQEAALKIVNEELPHIPKPYAPSDFGIPDIKALMKRIEAFEEGWEIGRRG